MGRTFHKDKAIAKRINLTFRKFTNKNRETVRLAIILGHLLNKEKQRVTECKIPWEEFASNEFPQLHDKTRQRFMRLSRLTNIPYQKSLHLLSLSTLYDLCSLCDPDDIESFLSKNQIEPNFKLSNKSVNEFQTAVNQLIKKLGKKKKPSSIPKFPKQFPKWLNSLEKRAKKKTFQLKDGNIAKLKKWRLKLSTIITAAENR